jgi:tryptophan 2,3-dioxygenase
MARLPCGHHVRERSQVHYCSYLSLDSLLALQPGREEVRHPDEHLFVVTHQSFELWFTQLLWDMRRIIEALDRDDVALATWLAQRCSTIVRLFSPMIRVLETMTPSDFFAFRAHLSPASGHESGQWGEIEVLAGLRDESFRTQLQTPLSDSPGEGVQSYLWTERLSEMWDEPSVASALSDLLARHGVDASDLYQIAPADNPNGTLMLLAEALLDFDEEVRLWRFTHARTAERAIGPDMEGTGHTSGVRYLDYVAMRRPHFFPDLWKARGDLWERQLSQKRDMEGA